MSNKFDVFFFALAEILSTFRKEEKNEYTAKLLNFIN